MHNADLVNYISLVARILTLGSLFQALQLMPYYLGIANGHTKTNVKLGFFSVIFLVPSIVFLVSKWGIVGAGIPWFIMSFITFFLLGFLIIKKFIPKYFIKWIVGIFELLFLISIIVGVFYWLNGRKNGLLFCFVSGLVGLGTSILIYDKKFPKEEAWSKIIDIINLKNK